MDAGGKEKSEEKLGSNQSKSVSKVGIKAGSRFSAFSTREDFADQNHAILENRAG